MMEILTQIYSYLKRISGSLINIYLENGFLIMDNLSVELLDGKVIIKGINENYEDIQFSIGNDELMTYEEDDFSLILMTTNGRVEIENQY